MMIAFVVLDQNGVAERAVRGIDGVFVSGDLIAVATPAPSLADAQAEANLCPSDPKPTVVGVHDYDPEAAADLLGKTWDGSTFV